MGIVLDTNIIVSGLLWSGPPGEILESALKGRWIVFASAPMLDEIERVLRRPKLAARYRHLRTTPDESLLVVKELSRLVTPVEVPDAAIRDPSDVILLQCALASNADYLVTGDSDLLVLGSFGNTAIVTPRDFLDRMNAIDNPE